MASHPQYLHFFKTDISTFEKPQKFDYPFCYEPVALSKLAAQELQSYLEEQQDFVHNFGINEQQGCPIGKMFGVLVVETPNGQLGFLAACSGKLAGTNTHRYLVPPVFDMLTQDSFFLLEEEEINQLNRDIAQLQRNPEIPTLESSLADRRIQAEDALKQSRIDMKRSKATRQETRLANQASMDEGDYALLIEDLIKQSYRDQHENALLKTYWKEQVQTVESRLSAIHAEITKLKTLRKYKSATLQAQLFDQYRFLNANGEQASLLTIFNKTEATVPPAGAGECAAPKLLQYAFLENLKPIAMAEFWWGASPPSEVRNHKSYYPACKLKCEPILGHMLQGMSIDDNPLLLNPAVDKELEIIYTDKDIVVVNKPAEFLSVPGINIQDSVYTRIVEQFPEIDGPVIIHRLDMSTSGILVLAKNKEAHQFIQDQFIKHTVIKRYTALLEGEVKAINGHIDLPLRVDLDDRPRQLICYTHGKPAQTRYEVQEVANGQTRIHFFPETGRTHQLRVHAAHQLGLGCPIIGDDLYGQRADRLHLHAAFIQFIHPKSKETINFSVPDPF